MEREAIVPLSRSFHETRFISEGNEVAYNGSDLTTGQQIVRELVDVDLKPPLVKREYQSLGRLHGELRFRGFKLVNKKACGPEDGYMLIYAKGSIIVRIKTRGTRGEFRGGVPHLTVSLLWGGNSKSGELDTSFKAEVGKFHSAGGVVNKVANKESPLYDKETSPLAKGNSEDWSDGTHFDFPDLYLDDRMVHSLEPG